MTTVDALKRLYVALGGNADYFNAVTNPEAIKKIYEIRGGNPDDVSNMDTTPEVVDALAYLSGGITLVYAMEGSTELWGYTISDLQDNIVPSVSMGTITGTLNLIESGSLADVWGPGYFIALTFATSNPATDSVSVAILPTEGAGWQMLDEDMACVFKVTNKDTQKIYVRQTDGVNTITQAFDLSGITIGGK